MGKWRSLFVDNQESGNALAVLHYHLGESSAPVVIVCHGFTGSKEGDGRHLRFAEFLAQNGWQTVLFDFAGNGQSEGDFAFSSLSTQISDLTAVVDWVQLFSPRRLVCLGRSFGGTTAICQAARDQRVQAVCTWAAPARLHLLFDRFRVSVHGDRIRLQSEAGAIEVAHQFFSDFERIDPLQEVARLAPRPYWCVHGKADTTVPVADGQLLYAAAGSPKAAYWVDRGDHQLHAQQQQVWAQTRSWFDALERSGG